MGSRRRYATALLAVLALALSACTAAADGGRDEPFIGMLRVVPDEDQPVFVAELRAQGWGDVTIDPASGDGVVADVETARTTLRRWRAEGVDLVVAFSTPFAELLLEELGDVPGLFLVNDPVAAGLVDDLGSPSRGVTGVTFRSPADRTLDLARQAIAGLEHVGYLAPASDPAVPGHRDGVLAAAAALGVEVSAATYEDPSAVQAAVDDLVSAGVDAVYLASATGTIRALSEIQTALDAAGLPSIANTDFVSFAVVVLTPDGEEVRRQLARQAARLLAGADVSSVPVEDPRKFVVILNRTKAAALGLPELDPNLLRQADVVR